MCFKKIKTFRAKLYLQHFYTKLNSKFTLISGLKLRQGIFFQYICRNLRYILCMVEKRYSFLGLTYNYILYFHHFYSLEFEIYPDLRARMAPGIYFLFFTEIYFKFYVCLQQIKIFIGLTYISTIFTRLNLKYTLISE